MDDIQFEKPLLPPEDNVAYIKDSETAGLSGGVCELAWLKIDMSTLSIMERHCYRTNPERPIDPGATAIHGITDDMVADCPTVLEVVSEFDFLTRGVNFIAHNAAFDKRMLAGHVTAHSTLCTLDLSRQYIKGTSKHKLEVLQKELKLPVRQSHSALGDVLTVHDLLKVIMPLTGVDLQTLFHRASLPQMLRTMPFGMHRGKPFTKVPKSYRSWMREQEGLPKDLSYTLDKYAHI